PERVQRYGRAVQYFRKENGGQASALNFGIAQAKGDVVALLDGDDVWAPNKLSRVAQEFEKDTRVVMVYNRYSFWDDKSGRIWLPGFPLVAGTVPADRGKLLEYCGAPTSSLAFRRSA